MILAGKKDFFLAIDIQTKAIADFLQRPLFCIAFYPILPLQTIFVYVANARAPVATQRIFCRIFQPE
jgi:hypothetical protein